MFLEALADEVGKDFDPFDLSATSPSTSRRSPAASGPSSVQKRDYFAKYGEQARAVLEALLDKYADAGH